jgi:hypothetical protein
MTAINKLNTTSLRLAFQEKGSTVAYDKPQNEESRGDPCNMILSLVAGSSIQDCSPVLGTQNLIHAQKCIPNSTKRNFMCLLGDWIDRGYVTPYKLASENSAKEVYHE